MSLVVALGTASAGCSDDVDDGIGGSTATATANSTAIVTSNTTTTTTTTTTANVASTATSASTGGLGACASDAPDALVYFDDFETATPGEGLVGRGADGFTWSDAANVAASDENAASGERSARFTFSDGTGSWSQLWFDLGGDRRSVSLSFMLYLPDGAEPYGGAAHRLRNGANNKFFRLWPGSPADYGSGEKLGASTWGADGSDTEATLMGDWAEDGSAAVGPGFTVAPVPSFFGAADRGQWMSVRVEVVAPTAKGAGPGALRIWKNGALVSEEAPDNFTEGEPHAYRFGYLLGTANSGFDEETLLFVDDVCFVALP